MLKVQAQRYEIGGGIGVSAYSGEIVRRLEQGRVGLQGTFFGRRNFDNVWSLRAGLTVAGISAADSLTRLDPAAIHRDAYFKGRIAEATAVMEYHFLDFMHPQSQFRFSPYGFFGLGLSYYMGTGRAFAFDEEHGMFSTITPVIPFGIGVKYRISKKWILATEMGFRATFTDKLDKIDGSQPIVPRFRDQSNPDVPFGYNSANNSTNDWYYFFGVSISYSFSTMKCFAY